jgi:FkbM family methyltransferase
MTWHVAAEGSYDEYAINALIPYITPGAIVLDVGASLGLWTVQLGVAARERGATVHSFEPNPANIPWLTRNVALNDLQHVVTIHPVGLGEVDTEVSLGLTEGGVGNGAVLPTDSTSAAEHKVVLQRLDGQSFDAPVCLIKLDVEGYEPSILRGAPRLLARDRPVIFGEFSNGWFRARGEDVNDVLRSLDYDPFEVVPQRSRRWRAFDRAAIRPLTVPISPTEDLLLKPR